MTSFIMAAEKWCTCPCVPDGYEPLPYQVAGHLYTNGKVGMLRPCGDDDGKLLKPIQLPPKGQRELDFYLAVFTYPSPSSVQLAFRQWVPRFDGIVSLSNQKGYLCLEDLVAPYTNASVADIKIGRRCWDDHASPEKVRSETRKFPLQSTLGYRIAGMRLYNRENDEYVTYSKRLCLTFDELGVHNELENFFDGSTDDVSEVLAQLHELLALFEKQKEVHFFSSSLLLIRECASNAPQCRASVHMIDFAHTYFLPDKQPHIDDNYLFGLRNLVSTVETFTH